MRVGLDMDGCIYNFVDSLAAWHHNQTGEELDPNPTTWHFAGEDWGWTDEFFMKTCKESSDAGWLFAMGQPIPGAIESVRCLHDMGHDIDIITARTKDVFGDRCEQNTVDWLTHYKVPYDTLTFSSDKTQPQTDFFLDDFAPNVDALRAKGTKAYLLDHFSLNDWRDHPYRVNSWLEFVWRLSEDLWRAAA